MTRTKATVRRINTPSFLVATGQRIGNKNFLNRKNAMFLPQQKQMEVTKMVEWYVK